MSYSQGISTHILTKRMTGTMSLLAQLRDISTHILTKRMTVFLKFHWNLVFISTHILTKRMTHETPSLFPMVYISTHILTKRMTPNPWKNITRSIFQLTSSRRGWLHLKWIEAKQQHFNSHPHEEDDGHWNHVYSPAFVFQLTSSRRGWHWPDGSVCVSNHISTHILTKRMTGTK